MRYIEKEITRDEATVLQAVGAAYSDDWWWDYTPRAIGKLLCDFPLPPQDTVYHRVPKENEYGSHHYFYTLSKEQIMSHQHPKAIAAASVALAKRQERERQRKELKMWTRKYRLRFIEVGDTTFCIHQNFRIIEVSTALFNPNDKRRDVPLGRYIAAQRWVDGERIQLKRRWGGNWRRADNLPSLLRNLASFM